MRVFGGGVCVLRERENCCLLFIELKMLPKPLCVCMFVCLCVCVCVCVNVCGVCDIERVFVCCLYVGYVGLG